MHAECVVSTSLKQYILGCTCTTILLPFIFEIHSSGDVTRTANECTEPDEVFNSTISVLPGTSIVLTCYLLDIVVSWNSSSFATPPLLDHNVRSTVESGIEFVWGGTVEPARPICTYSIATITNIQESMDGLDLTCINTLTGFNSTVVFDVIGK